LLVRNPVHVTKVFDGRMLVNLLCAKLLLVALPMYFDIDGLRSNCEPAYS
jgi:hypothetical protein